MTPLFYISAAIAIIASLMVITRANAMHALIYLVITVLAVASIFYSLGAAFVAALQILVYAGAIMVLFVFVVMMLNLGGDAEKHERTLMGGLIWILPAVLALALLGSFLAAVIGCAPAAAGAVSTASQVGASLFTTYIIGVEIASVLLIAALVAAYHFAMIPEMMEVEGE